MQYLANDGTIFDSESDCEEYEENYIEIYAPKLVKYLVTQNPKIDFDQTSLARLLFNIFEDGTFDYTQISLKN